MIIISDVCIAIGVFLAGIGVAMWYQQRPKILCEMGFHEWSSWSGVLKCRVGGIFMKDSDGLCQRRDCAKCGKIEFRSL